ncbi:DUF1009 family protein [Constrictibacter sp. MBR-5]|jgi:DUF1009 family protein|uniref:LpxI family protein n=1 Tax=Constrictibacter sp. MBR-5 TaxID=3156467 RepID=UPI00339650F0
MHPRLALVAGGGDLPALILEACRSAGRPCFVMALEGHADPALVVGAPHAWIRLGAAASAVDRLKAEGVEEVVLAGAVRRPSVAELRPDLRTLRFLTGVARHAAGDDALLGAVVRAIEAEGFRVVAAESIVRDVALPVGLAGRHPVPDGAHDDIARGMAVVRALGTVDVGQAAVVQQGIVLAVEAAEGTDGVLARSGSLRRAGRGGVLVKMAKPGQDRRVDRPTIGRGTIEAAAAAGLCGIAAEAGATFVIERAATVADADAAGLFLLGVRPDREG